MSNPTDWIEAHPADLIRWTEGRGLVGTGTPWEPESYDGVDYKIGQANNALVFPGIGLGTVVARASQVTPDIIRTAAEAVAGLVATDRLVDTYITNVSRRFPQALLTSGASVYPMHRDCGPFRPPSPWQLFGGS